MSARALEAEGPLLAQTTLGINGKNGVETGRANRKRAALKIYVSLEP